MEPLPNKSKARVKLFNNSYKALQENIKTVLKKTSHATFSVSKAKDVDRFSREMDENILLFNQSDIELLSKVKLLNQFFENKPTLSVANKATVWKYLEVLYTISSGKKQEIVKVSDSFDMSKLGDMVGTLMGDESSGFKDLINDISSKLESTLVNKDIDQAKLLQDLMAGKMESSGVDFGSIISQATKSLKEKVDAGEVDLDKIKDVTDKLRGNLNIT